MREKGHSRYNIYPSTNEVEANLIRLATARVLVLQYLSEAAQQQPAGPGRAQLTQLSRRILTELGLVLEWLQKMEIDRGLGDLRGHNKSELFYLREKRDQLDKLIIEKELKTKVLWACEG